VADDAGASIDRRKLWGDTPSLPPTGLSQEQVTIMEKTKLTLRIEKPIIESAKDYARHHNTTLSRLVAEFLRSLKTTNAAPRSPILEELSGILPADVSLEEHRAYLEEKYER
jgi:hypothetical protein